MVSVLFGLALAQSNQVVSIHVDGEGFLKFMREGRTVYTRDASLKVSGGMLVHASGYPLLPNIEGIGAGEGIEVTEKGEVWAISASRRKVGALTLAVFPDGLRPIESQGFYICADRPQAAAAGTGRAGLIRMGKRLAPGGAAVLQPTPAPRPDRPAPIRVVSSQLSITLPEEVEASAGSIQLGQIAQIEGPESIAKAARSIEVGSAPGFGVTWSLSRTSIESKLARAGISLSATKLSCPDTIRISRKGQKVSHDQMVDAAKAAIAKVAVSETTLEANGAGPAMVVPEGDLKLETENVALVGSRGSAVVVIYVDGKRINSRTIQLVATTPVSQFRVGQQVNVRVKSRGAVVQTTAKIKRIDIARGEAIVETVTGALLTGKPSKDGAIEVTI